MKSESESTLKSSTRLDLRIGSPALYGLRSISVLDVDTSLVTSRSRKALSK